ncbi:MAG: HD domain-containing protein [Candidatus Acidiferrales bacterium]
MDKNTHEVRDPIHVFIRYDSAERVVIDSAAVQRLRHIHQLAMSYLVYPGATHRRFEHSLGVMELSGHVFDIVTRQENVSDNIREQLPQLTKPDELRYWRRVLRMAALCHDVGHLPFSHAAEKELLPEGHGHEQLSREIILGADMRGIWDSMTPPLRAEDIAKIALGPKEAKGVKFSVWETILSEIIVGDAFGVDRMDYLIRDSHHSGVLYGRFDHHRLIDTLRILSTPDSGEPALGVEQGGVQSAEAMLWARYFMYSQVYFHQVRRIYDIHLKDFLVSWLDGGKFSTDIRQHLQMTDNEVMAALLKESRNPGSKASDPARRIVSHDHFRLLYERHPSDVAQNRDAGKLIFEAVADKFGEKNIRRDSYTQRSGVFDFPVQRKDDRTVSSLLVSGTLGKMPVVAVDYIYIVREKRDEAHKWLESNRRSILEKREAEN